MGTIGKITAGGSTHLIASTAYGTCTVAASTTKKTVTLTDSSAFTLYTGVTVHVKFTNSNTASSPTLQVGSSTAKSIVKNGTTAVGTTVATSWLAGAVVSFTYDGTNWVMNTGIDTDTTYTAASSAPGSIAASGSVGSSTNYARQDHTHAITVGQGDSSGEVKIAGQNASVNGWTNKANLASPEFTGTPKAPTADAGTNTTQIATTAFVTTAISNSFAANDAMVFKGTIAGGSTGAYGALTSAANAGDTYKVSTAGKINGIAVEVGDMLICTADNTAAANSSNYGTIAASWTVVQTNIDGAVTGPASSTENHFALFDGETGKVIKDSGVTLDTSSGSTTKWLTEKGTWTTPSYSQVDAAASSHTHGNLSNDGKITQSQNLAVNDYIIIGDNSDGGKLIKGPTFDASTTTKCLTKSGTWEDFNNYELPTATDSNIGGIKIGYTESNKNYAVKLSSAQAYVTVPWTDTNVTQTEATSSTAGDYEILFTNTSINSLSDSPITEGVKRYSNFKYTPSTDTLSVGKISTTGTINGLTFSTETSSFSITGGNTTSKTLTINNNYVLGAACEKGYENSTSASALSTGSNLVTESDVYYGLPTINGGHSYTSNTNIYVPTSVGTQYQFLTADSNGYPTWTSTGNGALYATSTNGELTFGTLPVAQGGTGQNTYTIGDILYASNSTTLTKLAGNTTTTRKFLCSVAAVADTATAPIWNTITKTDVGLSNVENTALSTWAGTSNITTIGTISNTIKSTTGFEITRSDIDASLANNNVSSTQYLGLQMKDNNNRITGCIESSIQAGGIIQTNMYSRNFDTSGNIINMPIIRVVSYKTGAATIQLASTAASGTTYVTTNQLNMSDNVVQIVTGNSKRGYLHLKTEADAQFDILFYRSSSTKTWAISSRESASAFLGVYNHIQNVWAIQIAESDSDITLKKALTIANGGTGATSAQNARVNLGAFPRIANVSTASALNIRKNSITYSDGADDGGSTKFYGTLLTMTQNTDESDSARVSQLFIQSSSANADMKVRTYSGQWNAWKTVYTSATTVPVSNGGTGATTAAAALASIGAVQNNTAWNGVSAGLGHFCYEGSYASSMSLPIDNVEILTLSKNATRGVALAAKWSSGEYGLWINRMHDSWKGWQPLSNTYYAAASTEKVIGYWGATSKPIYRYVIINNSVTGTGTQTIGTLPRTPDTIINVYGSYLNADGNLHRVIPFYNSTAYFVGVGVTSGKVVQCTFGSSMNDTKKVRLVVEYTAS